MTHYLKTWPEHFQAVQGGSKRAELRLNDRNYKVGDVLVLQEYSPGGVEHFYDPSQYSGDGEIFHEAGYTDSLPITAEVTHVLHGGEFGLAAGYVMLSIDCIDLE